MLSSSGAAFLLIPVAFSPALTCPSQLGSGTSANEGTEGGAEGGGAGIYKGVYEVRGEISERFCES